jgi:hypothetical protein
MSVTAVRRQKVKKAAQSLASPRTEQMTDNLRDRENYVVEGPSFGPSKIIQSYP